MCPHTSFEIIYYEDGVLLRRCKNCGLIELRSDWIWCDITAIMDALATIDPVSALIGHHSDTTNATL